MRYWLVMPAAGAGRRFGNELPKQYQPLRGRSVLAWALRPFLSDPACAGVVLALAADDPYGPAVRDALPREVTTVRGGQERCHSVRAGLAALEGRLDSTDWVLVHDAARPCLTAQDLQGLTGECAGHPVGGVLAAPVSDTLKLAGADALVERTVDRSGLWRALTPQMFRLGPLCAALDAAIAAGRLPTDESQALEWTGARPLLVAGSALNIKITTAADLALAEALLATAGDSP